MAFLGEWLARPEVPVVAWLMTKELNVTSFSVPTALSAGTAGTTLRASNCHDCQWIESFAKDAIATNVH